MIGNRHSCLEDPEIHKFQSYQISVSFHVCSTNPLLIGRNSPSEKQRPPFSCKAEELSFSSHHESWNTSNAAPLTITHQLITASILRQSKGQHRSGIESWDTNPTYPAIRPPPHPRSTTNHASSTSIKALHTSGVKADSSAASPALDPHPPHCRPHIWPLSPPTRASHLNIWKHHDTRPRLRNSCSLLHQLFRIKRTR